MERHVKAVADGQHALVEVDIVVIKADRFADPHAAPKHGLWPPAGAAADPAARLPHPSADGQSSEQTAADTSARAVEHGDEHVIKFADTAVEVFARTGDPDAIAAALRAAELIEP